MTLVIGISLVVVLITMFVLDIVKKTRQDAYDDYLRYEYNVEPQTQDKATVLAYYHNNR